jgi:hypothetical protein
MKVILSTWSEHPAAVRVWCNEARIELALTESVQDVLSSSRRWLQALRQDLRFSLKVFVSNPKFSLVAVFTLALGIAINSTVFSWIDSLLLHPYPGVDDTGGLALIETQTLSGEHLVACRWSPGRAWSLLSPGCWSELGALS